ncbi:alpha-glucan family phosphorylase [uncultured Mucilaginibacter sp.]|uniref:alpha-glucan family phosphorylase n=1 Tax=uncultured Mucilaginibacter sp. TaxID=797541 RepID=UPI0025D6E7DD|nr:alpha-glucan family phosphorylase [uncultured Mucilaginibacter sp.]
MNYPFQHPYPINKEFKKPAAYFCLEFAIHQPLKTYSGGLGYLAGSFMRSAYELGQNIVGIGILWKYGYYNQGRKGDDTMEVLFQEKVYHFLEETGIKFTIKISGHDVWVTAFYLQPDLFKTAPLFFLTTDLPENDYLSKTISHKLYDSNPETRAAAAILLGEGGARLLEQISYQPDVYHLNESHALPLAFYLYRKYRSVREVKKRFVFTNHTPEAGGNQKSDIYLLQRMGFWGDMPIEEFRKITQCYDDNLDQTLTALRFAGKANAVSKIHLSTLEDMWKGYTGICPLISVTNAQNYAYWADKEMYVALTSNADKALIARKKECKATLFEEVADQCGVILDPDVLTIVFAKRFAGYKRAELLLHDMDRLHRLLSSKETPIQVIWAGKPYPLDYEAISSFDKIVNLCKSYPNCAILVGYELRLSRLLKQGADVWLNTPRLTREASGTSGMSAAMNGCVNVSIPDGWVPEFARDGINSFIIPNTEVTEHKFQQDETDAHNLYNLLEDTVIPLYYLHPEAWLSVIKNSMHDILPNFDSNRMAKEYYDHLYNISESDSTPNPGN